MNANHEKMLNTVDKALKDKAVGKLTFWDDEDCPNCMLGWAAHANGTTAHAYHPDGVSPGTMGDGRYKREQKFWTTALDLRPDCGDKLFEYVSLSDCDSYSLFSCVTTNNDYGDQDKARAWLEYILREFGNA